MRWTIVLIVLIALSVAASASAQWVKGFNRHAPVNLNHSVR